MYIKELKIEFARSFYSIVTFFIKILLSVQMPFTKKKQYYTETSKHKSNINLPPPIINKSANKLNWKQIIDIRQKNNIKTKPIKHRSYIPQTLRCPNCNAPKDYIYSNGYSYLCSLCGRQVQKKSKKIKHNKHISLHCPFCGSNLQPKKYRSFFIVYKCINPNCAHKRKYKTRYTWRLFTLDNKSPLQNITYPVKLTHIHSHIHILATILYFAVDLALASTTISNALKTLFGINLSHKTIDNYKYATANLLYNFFFSHKISLPDTIIIDETYISILGKTCYLFTALNIYNREVLAFFVSKKRDGNSVFNLLELLTMRASNNSTNCRIITDGAAFYKAAIYCANLILNTNFHHEVVKGLKNYHPLRKFKNMIERSYSTYHQSYKSHRGLKSFNAAVAHTTLFFCYYNFFRPHISLNNSTPTKIHHININDNPIKKWLTLLSTASNLSPPN